MTHDLAVIGGGIMGASAAIRAAEGGMRVVLFERSDLGNGASGVNAGTLSLQIKRVALMPYALAGHHLWEEAGDAVGFRRTGGYTLAFTDREAALLEERMALKREAGAPIEMISPATLAAREPGLSRDVVAASWCAEDGYANSSLTGSFYRRRLHAAGVEVHEHCAVTSVTPGFRIETADGPATAKRVLLAGGFGLEALMAMLGVHIPVRVRVNTVSVTERAPPIVHAVIGHATGLLTLKQKANGTVLIGGGWQGKRDPVTGRGSVDPATLIPNLQLAAHAVPPLAKLRVLRSWTGFEANVADFYPLAGALPGVPDAFVLGCVRGGYTIGPYIGALMGDLILGRAPERPLFDPSRLLAPPSSDPVRRDHATAAS